MLSQQQKGYNNPLGANKDEPIMSSSQEDVYLRAESGDSGSIEHTPQSKMDEIERALREGKMEMSTGVILSMFAAQQQLIRDIKKRLSLK